MKKIILKGLLSFCLGGVFTLQAETLSNTVLSLPSTDIVVDFNGDGSTDILTRNYSNGNIYTILVENNGTNATLNKIVSGPENWFIMNKSDFNGDGITDILAWNYLDGNLYTLLVNSDGTETTLNKIENALSPDDWNILESADFNGDEVDDILLQRYSDGNLYTLIVANDGTSATLNKIVSGLSLDEWKVIKTADFNDDNIEDVLLQRFSDGNLYTAIVNSDGTSATLNKIASGLDYYWKILRLGYFSDFNYDKTTDILLQRVSDGNLYILLLNDEGTNASFKKIASGILEDDWDILQTGYFNDDGITDLLVRRKSDGNLYTLLIESDGDSSTLNKVVNAIPSSEWRIVGNGDFNGDDITDTLVQRKSDGNLYTILIDSDGTAATFNKIVSGVPNSEWRIINIADFNNDNHTDILIQRQSDGNLYTVILNESATSASLNKIVSGLDYNWELAKSSSLYNSAPVAISTNPLYEEVVSENSSDNNIYLDGYDEEGDNLHFQIIVPPEHGTVEIRFGVEAYYTPEEGYIGHDEFEFIIFDGELSSNVATILIDVSEQN